MRSPRETETPEHKSIMANLHKLLDNADELRTAPIVAPATKTCWSDHEESMDKAKVEYLRNSSQDNLTKWEKAVSDAQAFNKRQLTKSGNIPNAHTSTQMRFIGEQLVEIRKIKDELARKAAPVIPKTVPPAIPPKPWKSISASSQSAADAELKRELDRFDSAKHDVQRLSRTDQAISKAFQTALLTDDPVFRKPPKVATPKKLSASQNDRVAKVEHGVAVVKQDLVNMLDKHLKDHDAGAETLKAIEKQAEALNVDSTAFIKPPKKVEQQLSFFDRVTACFSHLFCCFWSKPAPLRQPGHGPGPAGPVNISFH